MISKIIIALSVAGLSTFGLTDQVQAGRSHGHRGGHHSGGHHTGGHHGGHHSHHRHHGHFAYYGFPFYTSYLGSYGYYQPYWYRSRLYRAPQYSNGSINLAVQGELARRGYYRGSIDGIIGPGTRRAIRAFQYDAGLSPSGWIDGQMLAELRLI